jgi:hypothetical protein
VSGFQEFISGVPAVIPVPLKRPVSRWSGMEPFSDWLKTIIHTRDNENSHTLKRLKLIL